MTLAEAPLPTAPERSLAQRMTALETANAVRTFRAKLKKDMKAGRVHAAGVLAEPVDERVKTMKVTDLLLAVPGIGRNKATQALKWAQIAPPKTVGGISRRQRKDLLHMLTGDSAIDYKRSTKYRDMEAARKIDAQLKRGIDPYAAVEVRA